MVARWMVRQNITHLHVHFGNAGASVGVLVKQLCQCHLSYTIHGPDEFDDVTGQQLRRKIAAADAIVCISQFVKSQLMRLSDPMHWPKMHLCRLGVNPQQFHFEPVESRPREDSEIAKVTRLLCVGRLTPAKCQVLLLQVCARLQNEGTPFQLTLIGDGPDRSRIERAIAELGLQRHVTLTGSLGQDAVKRYLKQSDIFVLPSLAEGIPVVLMEAMASGVPCISTSINGIPELIEHGHSGLLARPGDLDSLYDQLMRLIRDPRQRMAFSESGRSKVMADFQLSQNVRRLASVFSTFPASVG
jgi:glycosyltransferase involved in cell wall biosynthesis